MHIIDRLSSEKQETDEKQMSTICSVFGHKWSDGCTCLRCGLARDSGHSWSGCRCRLCNKIRDEQHSWDHCRCEKCGKSRDENHKFIYRQLYKEKDVSEESWCEGTCQICGKVIVVEHDDQPTGGKCSYRCKRCNYMHEAHDFKPLPGRCAEICSVCGEERDYMKIALDDSESFEKRRSAFKKLAEASAVPETILNNCADGKHILIKTKVTMQQFRGGTSYTEYQCVACGKLIREMDYGD